METIPMTISYQFGARILPDGQVVFRLWAPSAEKVELFIETNGTNSHYLMEQQEGGWFFSTVQPPGCLSCRYFFKIDDNIMVPDPASLAQERDVHGPSLLIPAGKNRGKDEKWRGRPWFETIIYELHVGTFTESGTFKAAAEKLDYLADLGITAIELMPLSDFPGQRNWGYDGVLHFAPAHCYGAPDDLRFLIDSAHARKLMVFLDVVYNHFGPEGNYLYCYAKPFFTDRHKTPWGKAINFDGRRSGTVRRFFIENALYWIEEFGFDGLRIDAVHAIFDNSATHVLHELAEAVAQGPGRDRHIHLILENDANTAHFLRWPGDRRANWYAAQWNDDIHHAFHTLLTGETAGYYNEFSSAAINHLARCLTEGFAWQGESSPFRGDKPRGEPSADLPLTSFISFLQNHDQIGNRAMGERLGHLTGEEALKAATAALILSPSIPMIFMGQEWSASTPFLFFCDFEPSLAAKITAGRRREFAAFPEFSSPARRKNIPDPCSEETFRRSRLNWQESSSAHHQPWLALHRHLFQLRREKIIPLLEAVCPGKGSYRLLNRTALQAQWRLRDGRILQLDLNLGATEITGVKHPTGDVIYTTAARENTLPPFFTGFSVTRDNLEQQYGQNDLPNGTK
ncbi:MAG: malto-oligosyltrehalose trehalohydrolase [Thermodesulfobacteriota bacterium]